MAGGSRSVHPCPRGVGGRCRHEPGAATSRSVQRRCALPPVAHTPGSSELARGWHAHASLSEKRACPRLRKLRVNPADGSHDRRRRACRPIAGPASTGTRAVPGSRDACARTHATTPRASTTARRAVGRARRTRHRAGTPRRSSPRRADSPSSCARSGRPGCWTRNARRVRQPTGRPCPRGWGAVCRAR